MKTLLICHEGATFDQVGLTSWLSSFSEVCGIIVLQEPPSRGWQRVRKEIQRSGFLRFLDVVAFRMYYKFFLAKSDRAWEVDLIRDLQQRYPCNLEQIPILRTNSPNSEAAKNFIQQAAPDLMLARCKSLIKPEIFQLPKCGTYVLHPGMCPEYRNAHGCFWALAANDVDKVAVTLLRIDAGVDTGPVYGYYSYPYDSLHESHIRIQLRGVSENLVSIRDKFQEIVAQRAIPLDTTGRSSAVWGQPWLTQYWKWKAQAKHARSSAPVS